jgi:hypothetical protein
MKKPTYKHSLEVAALLNSREIAAIYGEVFRIMPQRLTLSNGQTRVFKFVCNVDTRLIDRVITVADGGILYEVVVGATETVPGTPVASYNTNTKINKSASNSITVGATITGGTVIDFSETVTSAGGNAITLQDSQIGGRILGAGQTFWLRCTGIGATSAILYLLYGEIPLLGDNLYE